MKLFGVQVALVLAISSYAAEAATRAVTATIDILGYSDVSSLLPNTVGGLLTGGASRVAPVAAALRVSNPNTLVLFAGNTIDDASTAWNAEFKGLDMVAAHNAIGVDYATLGSHDLAFGIDGFANISKASNFTWLNANVYESSTSTLLRGTVPSVIKNFTDATHGSIKVGLFGITYSASNDSSSGVYFTDPLVAAKKQAAQLLASGAQFVIAITNQPVDEDTELSSTATDVDYIFGGQDGHSMLQTDYGAPYLKSDPNFHSLWNSNIKYYAATSSLVTTALFTHSFIPITSALATDAKVEKLITDYTAAFNKARDRVLATLCSRLDARKRVITQQEAAIGNIFANAMLSAYSSADAALINAGGIATDGKYSGELTLAQVLAWPTTGGSPVVVTQTTGKSLKAFLAKELAPSCGRSDVKPNAQYVHPAGFKYVFTCTGTGTGYLSKLEWLHHATKTGSIDDSVTLQLALPNDLFTQQFATTAGVSSSVVVSASAASTLSSTLVNYVSSQKNGVLCVAEEGRSTVLKRGS